MPKNQKLIERQELLAFDTNKSFAAFCRVTERTVERWRAGGRKVPGPVWALLDVALWLKENHTAVWLEILE